MYEKIDKNLYTPMMRQYLTIKENYPDTLVFFRLGDFYEMFFNDALVASKELEIVLTSRDAGVQNERVPMCGVPHHAVNSYIEKLSEKGYKVAIVEQMEAAGNKKIVTREVVKIITPGTNVDEAYLSEKDNNYLASIDKLTSTTINGYILSYIDLSTGDAKVTLIPDSYEHLYNELEKLAIKEVIVNNKFPKNITQYLKNNLSILVSIEDEYNVDSYLQPLIEHLEKETAKCCGRLINYIIKTQKRTLVHLKPFAEYKTTDYLVLDASAVKNLELVCSNRGEKNKKNLFSVLDLCSTAMGSRFLKRNILYPLTNLDTINQRLNIVEELTIKNTVATEVSKLLQEIYDLERIVGRISYGNLSPKDLIQLRNSIGVLPNIKELLKKSKTKHLTALENKIMTFDSLHSLLIASIRDDAPYIIRDGHIIKPGYSQELDDIINISSTNKTFLTSLEAREKTRTGIKSLKVGYNKVFGYYIEVTKANLHLVTPELGYIRKQTTSNSERYITEELKEREALILRSDERALELELEIFDQIRSICKDACPQLQKTADIISELDMLVAFSKAALENNYVKPKFSLYNDLEIIKGRHPVIEKYSDKPFIPNDLTMYNNDLILLITGPNMSGKSTYMRQTALIVIMAQMGSFVPCESATLPIFDKIFTRIGSSDDISSGESTFMTEMLEVNHCLQNATMRSLALFDEVGRGTATFDGMALAQAIIEYMHDEIGAKTLFSTHYHELTSIEQDLPNLKNVHVEAKQENDNITFFHKVMPGATDKSYGISVATLAKIPLKVTLRANDILEKLSQNKLPEANLLSKKNYTEPIIINNLDKNEASVINELKSLDTENLRPIDALLKLNELTERLKK